MKSRVPRPCSRRALARSKALRRSCTPEKIAENAAEVINTLLRLKPSSAKGTYVKSITLSSTMSPAVPVDPTQTKA